MDSSDFTIKELKEYLDKNNIDDNIINILENDNRKGVQKLAVKLQKKRRLKEEKIKKWKQMNNKIRKLHIKGYKYIAGIDEAGRGPLAGPVVASAVIFGQDTLIPGIDDSKKLSADKRDYYYDIINEKAIASGVGIVNNKIIDRINILQATFKAMRLAINNLNIESDYILVDGNRIIPDIKNSQEAIVDGDSKVTSIAAASILAKVSRDRIIDKYDKIYPEYGFIRNKGYGTEEHILALKKYGPSPIHRFSFNIVKKSTLTKEEKNG